MTVALNYEGRGAMVIDITGVASIVAGAQGYVANPEGVSLLVTKATIQFITPSTGSGNLGIGIAATAATKATDILNDLDANTPSAGDWYNGFARQNGAKTQVSAPAVWTTSKYLTFSASSTLVGLIARLYLEYIRL